MSRAMPAAGRVERRRPFATRVARLVWPAGADAPERAIRVALATACVATVAAVASTIPAWQSGNGAAGSAVGEARRSPARSSGTALAGSPGYTRWEVPAARSLLMAPAIGRDGHAWVAEMESETLTLHHPSGRAPDAFPLPRDGDPHTAGVAVDRTNTVWLAQDGTHTIARFEPETRRYVAYPTPTERSSPFGITVDGGGRVWFTEVAARQIGVFDPATERFTEYPLPLDGVHPYWLAVAPDGRVWFSTLTNPYVGALDPATGAVALTRVSGLEEWQGTTGLAIGGDGVVWFGVQGGKLGRLDPATGATMTYQSPSANAYGVTVDNAGRVWLATVGEAVHAFEPDTGRFCTVKTGAGAWWVTAAEDGAVWVSESVRGANKLGWVSPERAAAPCA